MYIMIPENSFTQNLLLFRSFISRNKVNKKFKGEKTTTFRL